MVSFVVALLQFCTQHENKFLLILLVGQNWSFFIVVVMLAASVTVALAFSTTLQWNAN